MAGVRRALPEPDFYRPSPCIIPIESPLGGGVLEGRGVLEVRPGRRIRIPRPEDEEDDGLGAVDMDPAQAGVQYKWERLRRQIEMDILSGTFRPGETLPTLKELGAR